MKPDNEPKGTQSSPASKPEKWKPELLRATGAVYLVGRPHDTIMVDILVPGFRNILNDEWEVRPEQDITKARYAVVERGLVSRFERRSDCNPDAPATLCAPVDLSRRRFVDLLVQVRTGSFMIEAQIVREFPARFEMLGLEPDHPVLLQFQREFPEWVEETAAF